MISINPISSPGQAASYFRRDDYYTHNQESPSAWHGRGAEALRLDGPVDRETFTRLLDGRLSDGTTLGRINSEGQREHIPGYDLTLSAPKSVSVAALVGGDDRLIEAHERAVKTTLDWIEREAAVTRVKVSGETHRENTGNLAIATFCHKTSRAQDPQLHTHSVIINATQRADGQWRSIEGRETYRVRALADRIYQSELAVRAQALGYQVEIDQERGRMELAAVPQEIRDHFSQRSQAIEADLAEKGKTRETATTQEREVSCLATRAAKVDLDRDQLTRHWQERAAGLGYDTRHLVAQAHAQAAQQPQIDRRAEAEQAVKMSIEHLAERSAAFRVRDLAETINSRFFGVATRAEIDQAIKDLKDRGELISKPVASLWNSRQTEAGYTTRQGQKIEHQLLSAAQRGRGAMGEGITSPDQARAAIARAESNGSSYSWNQEQRQAAEGILTTRDRVVAVQGAAGSAKTSTVLRTVAAEAREQGYDIRGLAPSASAARALESGAGIQSQTVHSWLGELRQAKIEAAKEQAQAQGNPQAQQEQPPSASSLWIVDEASMVGAKQFNSLLHAAEDHNARLVLVGDTQQLGSVEAGRAFAQVQERVQTYKLETILRQRDRQLLTAVEQAYSGQAARALREIDGRGGVIEISNPPVEGSRVGDRDAGLGARAGAIATDYLALSPADREKTLVIAPGHDDRKAINEAIREGLKTEGTVSQAGLKTEVLERRGLTQAEIKRVGSYKLGDVVRFGRGYAKHGIDKGSYWRVEGRDQDKVTLGRGDQKLDWIPARLSKVEVYKTQEIEVSQGDKIIFNKNDKDAGIINGQIGLIKSLDRNGNAEIMGRDGQVTTVNLRDNQHWTHGYAITAHAAQGHTADRALIHAESHRANLTTQRSLYVGVSRARDEVKIYTNSADALRQAVSERTGEKEQALGEREDRQRETDRDPGMERAGREREIQLER
ncbi:MAG: MobF family relaxase [Desulfobacca sp.]|nr:MobF family relaxase [Desulfobacca sp.]